MSDLRYWFFTLRKKPTFGADREYNAVAYVDIAEEISALRKEINAEYDILFFHEISKEQFDVLQASGL